MKTVNYLWGIFVIIISFLVIYDMYISGQWRLARNIIVISYASSLVIKPIDWLG